MWKWILQAFQIASAINMRRSTILFVLELLRQFNLSLVKPASQPNAKHRQKAGFVYVVRDWANGNRFKLGYRAKPPWKDSNLLTQIGESAVFILIIPAVDAKALEHSLRRAYGKGSKKSGWFKLENYELREILIIAALVMIVAGDGLGMSPVPKEIIQLAKKLLADLLALAGAIWEKATAKQPAGKQDGVDDGAPKLDGLAAIPQMDWDWESVLTKEYRSLPTLKGNKAYLTVIRDNDAKQGRIFFDDHPAKSLETAFVDRSLLFPLEIVLILKVDNKRKAKRTMLPSSSDQDDNDWVALSDETLGAAKNFASTEWYGYSIYVGLRTHFGLKTLPSDNFRGYPQLEEPAGYICVVQGVLPGKRRKIWRTSHPMHLASDRRLALMLNSPNQLLKAPDPIRFTCIISVEHAQSFEKYLHNRYRKQRRRKGWFELDCALLEEIRNMGRPRQQ